MKFKHAQPHWPVRFGPPGYGVNNAHPFIGLLVFLIIAALVVWAVIMISRHFTQHHHSDAPATSSAASESSDALKILNERFARGEIDADDFTRRRELLLQNR